jgi:hypothetical protein
VVGSGIDRWRRGVERECVSVRGGNRKKERGMEKKFLSVCEEGEGDKESM